MGLRPSTTSSHNGSGARAKRRLALAIAAVALLGALVSAHSLRPAARLGIARSCFRFADAWAQHFPLRAGKPVGYLIEPLLFAIGVLPVQAEIEPGVSIHLGSHDLIMRTILQTGQWEPDIWEAISSGLPPGGVFLDVGAHIGYYSLKAAVKVGKNGQAVAFEPNPIMVKLLRGNVAASNAGNIIVQPIACTDREQTLTLYAGREDNTGTASLSRQNAEFFTKAPPAQFTVRGRPIDDVVRELGLQRVDVVKVDVEGAEYYVLRGATETLRRLHPKLIVEIIPRQLASMQTKVEDVISLLQEAGYNQSRQIDQDNWEWTVRAGDGDHTR